MQKAATAKPKKRSSDPRRPSPWPSGPCTNEKINHSSRPQFVQRQRFRKEYFHYACVAHSSYMTLNEAITTFEYVMPHSCREMEKLPDKDPSEVDTETNPHTFASLASQYASSGVLFFDSHILAYANGYSQECNDELMKEPVDATEPQIVQFKKELIPTCFPRVDSVIDFSKRITLANG